MFKAPLAVPYRRPQIQGPQRRSRPLPPSPGQRRPRHPPGLWAAAPRPRSPSAPGRGGRPFLESSRPPQTQSPRCRRAGGVAGAPLEAEGGQRAGARPGVGGLRTAAAPEPRRGPSLPPARLPQPAARAAPGSPAGRAGNGPGAAGGGGAQRGPAEATPALPRRLPRPALFASGPRPWRLPRQGAAEAAAGAPWQRGGGGGPRGAGPGSLPRGESAWPGAALRQ